MIADTVATGRHAFRPRFLKTLFIGPFVFSDSGWQWWLYGKSAEPAARLMDRHQLNGSVVTLRHYKGRHAFRLDTGMANYFAKEVEMTSLRTRLGALLGKSNPLLRYTHGTAETRHNLIVDDHTGYGIRTFALGEYVRHGLPRRQILIHEYLDGWRSLGDAWREASGQTHQATLLARLERLLAALHANRICHLDLNASHIMVPADETAALRVIDCGKMCTEVKNPLIATALHVGKMMRDLNGHTLDEPALGEMALASFRRIVGDAADCAKSRQIVLLACRYRLGKKISKRHLVMNASLKHLNVAALEARALTDHKNRNRLATPARFTALPTSTVGGHPLCHAGYDATAHPISALNAVRSVRDMPREEARQISGKVG